MTSEFYIESNKSLRAFETIKIGLEKFHKSSADEFSTKTYLKNADCLKLLGDSQFHLKDLDASRVSYEKAQKIYIQYSIEDKASVIDSSIAVIYLLLKTNLDEAVQRVNKAIHYFGKSQDTVPQLEKAKQLLDLIKKTN